uniref:Nephronophthisis 4 n=1 Tax=Poecilia latipinna TaxID=48699 RepID=A0A3B3VZC3_9TELE
MADSWEEVFHKNRLVPPSSQTVRLAVENHLTANHSFQLSFSRLIVAQLPQVIQNISYVTYQLRVTLFDRKLQHFFGKTWKSSSQKMKNNKISFNEVLYLHTSLLLPSTLVVVELVSLSTKPDGSYLSLGRGFSILELFTNRPEGPGTNGDRRLNLHHGTPRGLLHPSLKDSVDYGNLLKVIDGAHLDCVMKTHPSLNSAVHLLPEHALVSGEDNIPGLILSPAGEVTRLCASETGAALKHWIEALLFSQI